MTVSAAISLGWNKDGTPQQSVVTLEGGTKTYLDEPVASDAADNLLMNIAIDVSELKMLVLISEESGLTVKTNSSGSPDNTLTLTAGKPLIWFTGCGHANPLAAADVTKFYVTNTGDVACTLKGFVLVDPTP